MLSFRIVRGPLPRAANEAILVEYNRLTRARIPIEEFEHWVQKSPAGPAWHALLETDEGRIVGHTSLFPFRAMHGGRRIIPAKSEYSILHEDFRKIKIRGFENVSRPAFVLILDRLFRHCIDLGWGPIFASTNEKNQAFTRRIGLKPLNFPLQECLLTLRPAKAARETPNIDPRQRAVLFAVGVGQRIAWSAANLLFSPAKDVLTVPVPTATIPSNGNCLSLFEDECSLKWRYLEMQYVRFASLSDPSAYLIAKRGSKDRYQRVVQWRMETSAQAKEIVRAMVRTALQDQALGVRWALYEGDPISTKIVSALKKFGFLCVPRVRIMMVHEQHPSFMSPAMWNMSDSLFSFDP
jgi:hypothetical protein